jgi:peptidoglycan hydrolase CwlO-like protein
MEDKDPKIDQLAERVARLEEDNKWYKEKFNEMEKNIEYLGKTVKDVDSRSWYILGGVIITLITTAIDIIVRLLH